jgi:alanyl-tRNA synthetase
MSIMKPVDIRDQFVETFAKAGFRRSQPLSLLQPSISTSFLFSVGFVDVLDAIAGNAVELDGAATLQRCFRHFDMERVSDGRHLSFFEMAGALRCQHWRIQDLVFPLIHFLCNECLLSPEKLHVTYFGGGNVAGVMLPPDDKARNAYLEAGISSNRIWPGDSSSNIWFEGANSGTERSGICGPNSEVFLEVTPAIDDRIHEGPLTQAARFIEVTNIVTITHRKLNGSNNGLLPLHTPLVELAVGMERIDTVIEGLTNVYESPKFRSIADSMRPFYAPSANNAVLEDARVVTMDHLRALTHLIADGGRPGPKGRGHVIRRLFRRLLKVSGTLNLNVRAAFPAIVDAIINVDRKLNPNLSKELPQVLQVFDRETARMQTALL